jgi:hypothetical protein
MNLFAWLRNLFDRRPRPMTCNRAATSAADMNTKMGQITNMGYSDGFRTVRLADGRWLSFTGDTVAPGGVFPVYDNSVVVWDRNGQRRIGTSGDPDGNFFPRWPDGSEFWPGSPIINGSLLYITGSRQKVTGPYEWVTLGAYGAVVQLSTCATPVFLRYFDTPSSGQDDTHVQWHGALARDSTYAYVHGVLDRPDMYHARDGGHIARVPIAQIEDLGQWRYWTGSTWVTDPAAAVPTIPCEVVGGTESGYTVHKRPNGMWAVTTKKGGTLADRLGRFNSPNPTGPWTWEELLTTCDLGCYLAGAANTIPTTSGKLLVYWSRGGAQPQWAEVAP